MLYSSCAAASIINDIEVSVSLDSFGTAKISECWDVEVGDDNTEWYIALNNFREMKISDFQLYDNLLNKFYADASPWDINRTRDEKAFKCGYVQKEGNDKELCWGVGSSGHHRWTATYTVSGFIKKYKDGCGFNHTFINHDMSSGPVHVKTIIERADSIPFSFDNAKIWAFNYKGNCIFDNGKIVAESTEPLTTSNAMTVMCIFPIEDFMWTDNVVTDTIGSMREKALQGSDYVYGDNEEEDSGFDLEVLAFLVVFVLIAIIICKISVYVCAMFFVFCFTLVWNIISLRPLRIWRRRRKLLEGHEDCIYFDIPLGGNLHRSFSIIDNNNYRIWPMSKELLISAYIMRLIGMGAIKVVRKNAENGDNTPYLLIEDGFYGVTGGPKGEISEKQIEDDFDSDEKSSAKVSIDEKCQRMIYKILYYAAGENHILESRELSKFSSKYEYKLMCLKQMLENGEPAATPEEFQQLYGLKRYLKNFGKEKTVKDISSMNEYLVFATLFDMRKNLLNSFKIYCPSFFQLSSLGTDESLLYYDNNSFFHHRSLHGLSSQMTSLTDTGDFGGGGGSSSSGGGGSTGGGGGGGGR